MLSSWMTPRYRWNPALMRYIDGSGRMVARDAVVAEMERHVRSAREQMLAISERLAAGQIALADWQRYMAAEIKIIHVQSAAIAKGGWAQMTPADWGAVGQRLRVQYRYLARFAADIASGRQPLNGRFWVRVKMYANASRGTRLAVQRRAAARAGFGEGRRVLDDAAEHCDGCLDVASRGWMSLAALPPIGTQECIVNCRCDEEYR